MQKALLSLYAVSPIHAGSGASTAAVDLPIQRERHTNWPHVQASAVKGAFRAHYRNNGKQDDALIQYIFGYDKQDGNIGSGDETTDIPGAVSFSDAKLLAFPVRSNISPFVWVTSALVLKRLKNDLNMIGKDFKLPSSEPVKEEAYTVNFDSNLESIILEDAVVTKKGKIELKDPEGVFGAANRLLLISDEMFEYAVSYCTEVQTQIKIDKNTGTTSTGSLRYQELLPADSLLYTLVMFWDAKKQEDDLKADMVMKNIKDSLKDFVQIGGDETLGRGICRINWVDGGEA